MGVYCKYLLFLPLNMPSKSTAKSDKIENQLSRIRGQIDGVIDMYQDERACIDIVRQIIATRNSLTKVARVLLTTEAQRCSDERRVEDLDDVLAEMFKY